MHHARYGPARGRRVEPAEGGRGVTLEEHRAAIEAAIKAAADEGFHLDTGGAVPPAQLDLNEVNEHGDPVAWVELDLPTNPLA
ncbi:hypothetical protein B5180_01770 [Streptomyces sp. BF-3]|nr:hypothetical protein B5180_01770 [Streptomyces sp. BF-3]